MSVRKLIAIGMAIGLTACSSSPALTRNQRLAAEIRSDRSWFGRQYCLKSNGFSPSVLMTCLDQQPPGYNDKAWTANCFDLADSGADISRGHRIIDVADCTLPDQFFD